VKSAYAGSAPSSRRPTDGNASQRMLGNRGLKDGGVGLKVTMIVMRERDDTMLRGRMNPLTMLGEADV
jgi:hypothetical protein